MKRARTQKNQRLISIHNDVAPCPSPSHDISFWARCQKNILQIQQIQQSLPINKLNKLKSESIDWENNFISIINFFQERKLFTFIAERQILFY